MKCHRFLMIAMIVISLAGLVTENVPVSAISNIGPDKRGEFDELNGANVTYYLANTESVRGATDMDVPIYKYTTRPSGDVIINAWCDARSADVSLTSPMLATVVDANGNDRNKLVCTGSTTNSGIEIRVPPSAFVQTTLRTDITVYRAMLHFKLKNQALSNTNRRGFKLSASSQYLFGYSTSNSDRFAVINQKRCNQETYANNEGGNDTSGCGKWHTYTIPFAPSCALNTISGTPQIVFYDMDNVDLSQPKGAQYKNYMTAIVQDIDYPNLKQVLDISGADGNKTKIIPIKVTPRHRYKLIVYDVYTNNVLQFKLPYDSINANQRCIDGGGDDGQEWSVTGATGANGTSVLPGQLMQWTHTLKKTNETNGERIDYEVMRSTNGVGGVYSAVQQGHVTLPSSADTREIYSYTSRYTPQLSDVGKTFCEYISWKPTASTDNTKSSTDKLCIQVAITPSVHVLGNDVRVGSDRNSANNRLSSILASVSQYSASGGQYGVLAPNIITEFASDSGALKPAPMSTTTLTFANRVTGYPKCTWGCYTYSGATSQNDFSKLSVLGSLPSIAAIPGVGAATPQRWQGVRVCDLGTTSNVTLRQGERLRCTDGSDLTFQANNYTDSLVVKTTGRLTLAGDITYPESIQHDNSMPQLILSAQNIDITATVGRVDAWLVATDSVNTCKDISDMRALRLNDVCGKPLKVNGPIVANKLALHRTYFNTATANEPAETLQLDGAAYVWAYQLGRKNGSWQTTSVTELPPRY